MNKINLKNLVTAHFSEAKNYWKFYYLCILILFVLDILANILESLTLIITVLTVVFVIVSQICKWWSVQLKNKSEVLLSKIELHEGVGIALDISEIVDNISISKRVKEKADLDTDSNNDYWSSSTPPSGLRLAENLRESSWYTKNLSKFMFKITLCLSLTIFIFCVVVLLIAVSLNTDRSAGSFIVKIVISVILLIFNLDTIFLSMDYFNYFIDAKKIEDKINDCLKKKTKINSNIVMELRNEYQIIRMTSPMIPDWAWKFKESGLNIMWKKYLSQ